MSGVLQRNQKDIGVNPDYEKQVRKVSSTIHRSKHNGNLKHQKWLVPWKGTKILQEVLSPDVVIPLGVAQWRITLLNMPGNKPILALINRQIKSSVCTRWGT